jgi:hypothetical protein
MRKFILFAFILSLFLIPSALAQTVSLDIEGACREYNATVSLAGFEVGSFHMAGTAYHIRY